jgi:hypothetical protein
MFDPTPQRNDVAWSHNSMLALAIHSTLILAIISLLPNPNFGSASFILPLSQNKVATDKAKLIKNFMICALDGIKAILGNIFLNVYYVHVLRRGFKLRIITRLTNRFVGLKVEYQDNLTKVSR